MNKNPLGISSFVLESPFGDEHLAVFPRVRAMGYDMMELCIEDPSRLSGPRVKEAAAEAGLNLTFGARRDMSHESPQGRQAGLDYLLQCVSLTERAAAVEAPIVSGPMYSAAGRHACCRPTSLRPNASGPSEGFEPPLTARETTESYWPLSL